MLCIYVLFLFNLCRYVDMSIHLRCYVVASRAKGILHWSRVIVREEYVFGVRLEQSDILVLVQINSCKLLVAV